MGGKATLYNAKYPLIKEKDYVSSVSHLTEQSLDHLSKLFGLFPDCLLRLGEGFFLLESAYYKAVIQISTRKGNGKVKNACFKLLIDKSSMYF